MANVNIPVSEELHKQLKLQALLEDKTLKDYIIDTLREEVNK